MVEKNQPRAELGTRQHCRDNVTMVAGLKVVGFCFFTIFVVATPSRHRYLNIFRFFFVPEALLRCRVVFVSKLNIVAYPALEKTARNWIVYSFRTAALYLLWDKFILSSIFYSVCLQIAVFFIIMISKINFFIIPQWEAEAGPLPRDVWQVLPKQRRQ